MTPIWDARAADWVAAHIPGCGRGFGKCQACFVVDVDGQIAAGVVFHNWNPDAGVVEVSAAAVNPKWATRSVLTALMGYAFGLCDCQMVVARTDEGNARVRRLWKAMGAQEYIIPRLRGRAASEAILCVTDDAWSQSRLNEARHG